MTLSLDTFLRVAKALADARRLEILERIAGTGQAACQHLCEQFPVSQPTMSHHLRLLVDVGLLEMRRDGQYVHYRIRTDTIRAYTATLEARLAVPAAANPAPAPPAASASARGARTTSPKRATTKLP